MLPEGFEVCYVGGIQLEREVNRLLLRDNANNDRLLKTYKVQLPTQLPYYLLEHVKTRCVSVLKREQAKEYMKEEEKMINKKFQLNYGRAFHWFPYLQVSMHTRFMAGEVFFGDTEIEEPNLAHGILSSVMRVSCTYLMVACSLSMKPGLKCLKI